MKPILFNTEMVQANLNGLKSATRRVAFPNKDLRKFPCHDNPDAWWFRGRVYTNWDSAMRSPQGVLSLCRYKKGDILYVRETWCDPNGTGYPILYRADMPMHWDAENTEMGIPVDLRAEDYKWRPSIHMPKEAARLFLRVKNVRVERLQDIDSEGIRAEGLNTLAVHVGDMEISLREFARLWDSTIKPADLRLYGWNANPWVWVIEYERCEKPEA